MRGGMEEAYVSSACNMSKEATLEWVTLELQGGGAPVFEFAEVFVQLFPDFTKEEQKRQCLELFRLYACIGAATINGEYDTVEEYQRKAYTNGVNIPADEIHSFEKVWDPDAPMRCLACKTTVPNEQPRCADCDAKVQHTFVYTGTQPTSSESKCGGDAVLSNRCCVCKHCGYGATFAGENPPFPARASESVRGVADANCMPHNYFHVDTEPIEVEVHSHKRKRL